MVPGRILLLLVLTLSLAPRTGANDLHLLDRFGPDGLPFTRDDPLAVGAYASEFRAAAMAGDSCSEETSFALTPDVQDHKGTVLGGAHAYPNGHPDYGISGRSKALEGTHVAREDLNTWLDNLILDQPFDLMTWLSAINLEDGSVLRVRVFPEEDLPMPWQDPDEDVSGREWQPNGSGLDEVWQGPTRNLHLDGFGMSYRDIMNPGGLAMGISNETWQKIGLSGPRLDMAVQQVFLESFVLEMMNLENDKAALSGNYTMDVAGLQLFIDFEGLPDQTIIDLDAPVFLGMSLPGEGSCSAGLNGVSMRLGDHVDPLTPFTDPPSEYFKTRRIPILIPEVRFTGSLEIGSRSADCQEMYDALMESRESGVIAWILDKIQSVGFDIEQTVIDWILSSSSRIQNRLDYLDSLADALSDGEYERVAEYSGLAGPPQQGESDNLKTPFDRIALGTLKELGQFNPKAWNPWLGIGDPPALKQIRGLHRLQEGGGSAISQEEFEAAAEGDLVTVEDRLAAKSGWRYNGGASYLSKSAMLFGNSVGAKNQTAKTFRNDPDLAFDYNPLEPLSDDARKQLPDLLRHFARWWIHPRLDLIDPYFEAEGSQIAAWTSMDILFDQEDDETKSLEIDWPPPNYQFGRAQVVAFRAGAGGVPDSASDPAYNVKTEHAVSVHGLLSVDFEGGTLAIAGTVMREPAGGSAQVINMSPARNSTGKGFGWVGPLPLEALSESNGSAIRWLTGAANHHREANAEFAWQWELDGNQETDSKHLQQMAEVAAVASLFAYQTKGDGNVRGRTGFSSVITDSGLIDQYTTLCEE